MWAPGTPHVRVQSRRIETAHGPRTGPPHTGRVAGLHTREPDRLILLRRIRALRLNLTQTRELLALLDAGNQRHPAAADSWVVDTGRLAMFHQLALARCAHLRDELADTEQLATTLARALSRRRHPGTQRPAPPADRSPHRR